MKNEAENHFDINLLGQLKQEDRALLESKYLQKKSLESMKEELNISESVLKMRLLRVRTEVIDLAKNQGLGNIEN